MNIPNKSLIFAHRGVEKVTPNDNTSIQEVIAENTRAAFNKALDYAIDGIETDVQLSLDEIPVLWHDWYLDKLGYHGKCIDDFKFEQLAAMDFASYASPRNNAEGAISLTEFIKTYQGRCALDIEIKSREDESQQRLEIKTKQILDIIHSIANDGVFISSFCLPSLVYSHQYAPNVPLYYLLSEFHSYNDIEQFVKEYDFLTGYCLPIDIHNEAIASLLQNNNKCIGVYTPNSVEDIQKALDLKVNILITDEPQLALKMRDL